MELNRQKLSKLIVSSLSAHKETLKRQYAESQSGIGYFFLDDVLPEEITREIFALFPDPSEMKLKNTIRERKYIAVQMDQYHPLLERNGLCVPGARSRPDRFRNLPDRTFDSR
ncbi:hypothetical protein [Flavobacterium sp.]|uniref:hypothetical protein n=1 Tax=Flavobacterium sp. TaxID=239 RepID=UPI0039E5852F